MSFFGGFEKQAGVRRLDALTNAAKRGKLPISRAHAELRKWDLSNQVRGLTGHLDTSAKRAIASRDATQAAGGAKAALK